MEAVSVCWGHWTRGRHGVLISPYVLRGVPQVQYLRLFSWADSFSSEKPLVSLLSGVVGGRISDHLSSRSQAGDGHSVPLRMA